MADDSPSWHIFNTPSFPTMSTCDGLEENIDGRNTLETNLNERALVLS